MSALRDRAYKFGAQFDAEAFDVEEALYWHCADFHEGQWSERYSILSVSPFKPSVLSNGPDGVVSQLIYDALAEGAK